MRIAHLGAEMNTIKDLKPVKPVTIVDQPTEKYIKAIAEKLDAHIKDTKQEMLSPERWIVKESFH